MTTSLPISKRTVLALALVALACSTRATSRVVPEPPRSAGPRRGPASNTPDRLIRVALPGSTPVFGSTSDLKWHGPDGPIPMLQVAGTATWKPERQRNGPHVRAVRSDGLATPWQRELSARSPNGMITLNGKRYRGEMAILPIDSGFLIVNRLGLEDYLRGVVPVEMGKRPRGDSAALQAQAIASRSYAVVRGVGEGGGTAFDVRATTLDQVYGGVDAENDEANAAIDATRGLVLRFQGRVVDAPFHSTCGGVTAAPTEVWRGGGGSAYLRSVSDRISGDRYYCDIAPRYRWTRTLSGSKLDAALQEYLRAYSTGPGVEAPGAAHVIGVRDRTPSGRVAVLEVEMDKGLFSLRGNDIRYVMREPGGEILPSTYFSVEPEYRDGRVARVTFRGQGNGHGVGMCQWGAIGRARAGQSFRSILGTYYPGTTVGPIASNSSAEPQR